MTDASSKVQTASAMLEATSVCGVVQAVVKSAKLGILNLIRFPSDYKAENAGRAAANAAKGESGRGKAQGVGHFIAHKIMGLAFNKKGGKLTVYINIKDMTHRQDAKQGGFKDADNREYQYAARTVADITDPSRRLDWIEVCDKFGKWKRISLAHLPIFDVPTKQGEDNFAAVKLALLNLGMRVFKLDAKVKSVKQKLRKAKKDRIQSADNSVVVYNPPEGETTQIQDAEGNHVKDIPRTVTNRGFLHAEVSQADADYFPQEWIQNGGRYNGNLCSFVEMLPVYMAALEDARAEYEKLNGLVRSLECGIIERNLDSETVTVGATEFEIHLNDDTEYDTPPDVAAKLKSGEYKEAKVPIRNGSWELTRSATLSPPVEKVAVG